jgi:hypothetical protein
MIRPTRLQCALAYLRNGDALPFPLACDCILTGGVSTALCLALGIWMGSGL